MLKDMIQQPNPNRSKRRWLAERLALVDKAREQAWSWNDIREALRAEGLEWQTNQGFFDALKGARRLVETGQVTPEPIDDPEEKGEPKREARKEKEGQSQDQGGGKHLKPDTPGQRFKDRREEQKKELYGSTPIGEWSTPPPKKED